MSKPLTDAHQAGERAVHHGRILRGPAAVMVRFDFTNIPKAMCAWSHRGQRREVRRLPPPTLPSRGAGFSDSPQPDLEGAARSHHLLADAWLEEPWRFSVVSKPPFQLCPPLASSVLICGGGLVRRALADKGFDCGFSARAGEAKTLEGVKVRPSRDARGPPEAFIRLCLGRMARSGRDVGPN